MNFFASLLSTALLIIGNYQALIELNLAFCLRNNFWFSIFVVSDGCDIFELLIQFILYFLVFIYDLQELLSLFPLIDQQ